MKSKSATLEEMVTGRVSPLELAQHAGGDLRLLANYQRQLDECIATALGGLTLPEEKKPSEWTKENRWLEHGVSWKSAKERVKFSFRDAPYQEEVVDATVDPLVQTVVMMWASDLGKTEVLANALGYFMDHDPSRCMVLYPIEKSIRAFSKDVLSPLIESVDTLAAKFNRSRSGKNSGNTLEHKQFPGGSITLVASNSPSSLRQRRARVVIGDEIDGMHGDVGNEGDPIFLLFKRSEGYEDSVQILSSTPTVRGLSRIEFWFEQSDRRLWFVPCYKCGKLDILKWRNVKWSGLNFERAVILCEKCGHAHNDRQRQEIVRAGKWKATAKFSGIRGYHINGLYSLFPAKKGYVSKLHQFAKDFYEAKHSQNPKHALRVWKNTFLAETDEDELEPRTAWEPIFERREDYIQNANEPGPVPEGVRVITCGIDIQGNRIELEYVGWGRDEQSWGLGHVIIPGEPEDERIWNELEPFMHRQFEHPSGVMLDLSIAFIDSGKWTDYVHKFASRASLRGKVYAIKGASEFGLPIIGRIRKAGRGNTYFRLGTDAAKEVIYGRLNLPVPEEGRPFPPGFMHFPKSYDAEFFQQLTTERVSTVFFKGQSFRKYKKEHDSDRNEALDLRVYALAAFRLKRWDWAALDLSIAEAVRKVKKPEPGAAQLGGVHDDDDDEGGGFVGGWRR